MRPGRGVARLLGPTLIASILAVHVEGCASMQAQPRIISESYDAGRTRGLVRVAPGSEIEFTRRDGTVLRGIFRGSDRMSDEEYARHWAEVVAKRGDADSLPRRGTLLEIRPHRGPLRTVRFEGFDYRGIEVRDSTGAAETVPFARLAEVRETGGRAWDVFALDGDAVSGRLPSFAVILLEVGSGVVRIPADHVAQVSHRDPSGNWVAGAVIGGVIGAVLVVWLVGSAIDQSFDQCGSSPIVTSGS